MIQIYFCTFICYPFPLRKDWIDHIHFKDSSYNISPTFVTLSINTYVRITHLLCNLSWELRGFYLLNVPYNYLVILIKKVFYKKKIKKRTTSTLDIYRYRRGTLWTDMRRKKKTRRLTKIICGSYKMLFHEGFELVIFSRKRLHA